MHKYTLVALLLILTAAPVAAQKWNALNVPTGDALTGLDIPSPDAIYVCTNTGKVGRSSDYGRSWEFQRVDFETQLQDVSFLESGLGFACGQRGALYRSADFGQSWENVTPGDTLEVYFSVEQFDDQRALVIGMDRGEETPYLGVAYTTDDGGESWKRWDTLGLGFSEIDIDPQTGIAVFPGYGQLIWTTDKGRSFNQKLSTEDGLARGISFRGKTVVLVGPQGFISTSKDGGNKWNTHKREVDKAFLTALVIDKNTAFAAGTKSQMLLTTDGGENWDAEDLDSSFDVMDMEQIGKRIYAVGTNGTMVYKDLE